ncbi:hypothetical protein ELQ90_16330 [Labedella phragmitis]|uniref:FtsX-like permease family protein n=2 Tax=Labedella TaxID=390250 RepID=A0A3S3ZE49_9MICO|nr:MULTISPECIES: FtsX-like permease family protein [Labedella]RWZ46052.1 hypothetical protein ELQ90_16330 [Labedella phragmitis]RWZ54823.1 hypothetical protein ELQ92_16050 [Labedella populi]
MATLAGISTVTGSAVNAQENAEALRVVEVLLAAGFVIAAALAAWGASLCVAVTIEQRRRDVAILRTIRMDASATRSLIRSEAWTVGVIACALGIVVGSTGGWASWAVLAGVVGGSYEFVLGQ